MRGRIEHVKWYVPGLSNLNEKLSFVSMAPERNSPVSLTTLCGSSSMLAQVTVAPALTVNDTGTNMKSFTMILVGSEVAAVDGLWAAIHHSIATLTAVSSDRYRPGIM